MPPARAGQASLVVVANRLPITRVDDEAGGTKWVTSPGGLVAALKPAMTDMDGVAWLGWTGEQAESTPAPFEHDGLRLVPIALSEQEHQLHYEGMSNGTLWPLYHGKIEPPEFHRHWFDGYRKVNRRFAVAAAEAAAPGAMVWIHDYQLQLVPGMLRELRPDLRIGFFLHIPFPSPELFVQLPWRNELTAAMLGADLLGFQSPADAANFHQLARALGLATRSGSAALEVAHRAVNVRSFPIGIDYQRYHQAAREPEVLEQSRMLRSQLGDPEVVLLGVDRLDYTKGIDVRLRAFKELLTEGRLDPGRVSMIQIAEPTRDQVEAYVSLRERVERLVGEINGDFGEVGLPVVHYIHRTQSFAELLAMYRAADVMLVTPFRDGMNLVAKEYVAARHEETGALVLSEFAGAAHQLKDALLVNPYDIDGVKNAIAAAAAMPAAEAQRRMRSMRRSVARHDAAGWATSFISTLRANGSPTW